MSKNPVVASFRIGLGIMAAVTALFLLAELALQQQKGGGTGASLWPSSSTKTTTTNLRFGTTASTERSRDESTGKNDDDNYDRPPLSSLIEYEAATATTTNNSAASSSAAAAVIKGDVQFLLDFCIIGHPKTATSFTMDWLAQHDDEVQMYRHELHALQSNRPAEFVRLMYELKPGRRYKRGYKAPRDIGNVDALNLLAEYWPNANMVVGLRHPVLWFESFYNFRVRQGYAMPPAHHPMFMGPCSKATHGVCTHESRFHRHLALLGKTNMSAADELDLFVPAFSTDNRRRPKYNPVPNKLFLYEITQLYNTNETRALLYRRDLSDYLGLRRTLSPIYHRRKDDDEDANNSTDRRQRRRRRRYHRRLATSTRNATEDGGEGERQQQLSHLLMDICEDRYGPLRAELVRNGRRASAWIRGYLLDHPDVTVSSPEYFRELLLSWARDPCVADGGGTGGNRRRSRR